MSDLVPTRADGPAPAPPPAGAGPAPEGRVAWLGEVAGDVVIVGGGIVGLATALALSESRPGARLVILEKEADVGRHQTGHNSGVVHSGIYYKPGSFKATLCREGVGLMRAFCAANGLPFVECGKVIVATSEAETGPLETLYERGTANGVPGLRLLSREELAELEPNVSGVKGILSPTTAIADDGAVARRLAEILEGRGARVVRGARATAVRTDASGVQVHGPGFAVRAGYLVNCAGLHADAVARLAGLEPAVRIVPFRGEYYLLREGREGLVRRLVYPVPNPALPFLGVHFTPTVAGRTEAGPNAVFAFAREGYRLAAFDAADTAATLAFPGFWHLAARFWRVGAYEYYRSLSKAAFVRSLQALVPTVTSDDLEPGPAGVRAQAVDRAGRLVDDFAFLAGYRSLHVLNAPSPAATASLAIGRHVAAKVAADLA